MKFMKKFSIITIALVFATAFSGCEKLGEDLERDPNRPTRSEVYGSGEDLRSNAGNLFNTWYTGTHSFSSVYMMLATASDNVTCSWGNQAMRDMSWEPRNAWNNAPNYTYQAITKYLFDKMYATIVPASDILYALNNGVEVGVGGADNNLVKAVCRFNQGISYGALAMFFDKAFIVDEVKSIPGATVDSSVSYEAVAEAALGYLDEAIALSASSFTVPAAWLGTTTDYSNVEFAKLCNSFAARIMSYMPRNKTEHAAVNWAKVKTYADAGLTSDFLINMDGYVKWYAEAADYLCYPGWGKVDMYVVHLLDDTQPAHWTDNSSFPTPPESTDPDDARMETDFEYSSLNWFQATRGYYHFSNYRYKRYDDQFALGVGPIPEFMKAENDILKAEARAYTSDLSGAATIINAGTRVTRGNMDAVPAVLADIEKAIHHERHVEMYLTGIGIPFFEMRKKDMLQKGTPLHWPLPGKTLETFAVKQPFYTFGGVANADGINTSNVGWR